MTTWSPAGTATRAGGRWRNWGRSESVVPQQFARPSSAAEVAELVTAASERGMPVKAVGSGHSFTGIAVAPGLQLDMSALTGVHSVDGTDVTIGAGTTLRALAPLLDSLGLALENIGDIDAQTISGAISTGTHGTGAAFGGLATRITGATLVTAAGEIMRVDARENSELLPAVAVGLGALGVLVDVTVRCVPSFLLHAVEQPQQVDAVLDEWPARIAGADHFEFHWFPHTSIALTKTNTRLPLAAGSAPLGRLRRWFDDRLMANTAFAGTVNTGRMLPPLVAPINRMSVKLTGDREFTDLSHRVFCSERRVRFREMEYAIPQHLAPVALREVRALIERKRWSISFPIEVRATAADDLWLSTASGRDSAYIAVHRYFRETPAEYFRGVEEIMVAHGGRPHWGKMHYRDAEDLAGDYPRFADFLALRGRLDPHRMFANDYLERVLGE